MTDTTTSATGRDESMAGGFRELKTNESGQTAFDGELIVSDDPFAVAIERARLDANPGRPVVLRVVEDDSDEVSWLEVDHTGAVSAVHGPASPRDEPGPSELQDAPAAGVAIPTPETPGARPAVLRPVLIGAACVAGVAILAGAVWAGLSWAGALTTESASTPSVTVQPTASSTVTLPGFRSEAAWSIDGVTAAAAAGGRVKRRD